MLKETSVLHLVQLHRERLKEEQDRTRKDQSRYVSLRDEIVKNRFGENDTPI